MPNYRNQIRSVTNIILMNYIHWLRACVRACVCVGECVRACKRVRACMFVCCECVYCICPPYSHIRKTRGSVRVDAYASLPLPVALWEWHPASCHHARGSSSGGGSSPAHATGSDLCPSRSAVHAVWSSTTNHGQFPRCQRVASGAMWAVG